jgi:anti-sigma28 factor (negative regulator of flagellin synthesis)
MQLAEGLVTPTILEEVTMATKKAPAKQAAKKTAARKYSPAAGKSVEREMKAMKQGKLKSGGNGKKVTNPKQAIAIGLSEARKAGKKIPPPPK